MANFEGIYLFYRTYSSLITVLRKQIIISFKNWFSQRFTFSKVNIIINHPHLLNWFRKLLRIHTIKMLRIWIHVQNFMKKASLTISVILTARQKYKVEIKNLFSFVMAQRNSRIQSERSSNQLLSIRCIMISLSDEPTLKSGTPRKWRYALRVSHYYNLEVISFVR